MTNDEFRRKLRDLDWTIAKFSKKCGIGYSTAKDWKITPDWVPLVLNYIEITEKIKLDYEDESSVIKKINALSQIKKIIADI